MSAVAARSCMQGELSKQEAAAVEALKEARARKLAALLSENKLQALQQKKAVEEALAQARGHAALQGALRGPEQQDVAQAGNSDGAIQKWHGARVYSRDTSASSSDCLPLQLTKHREHVDELQEQAVRGTGTGTWAGSFSGMLL